jgi:hypothetical protein
MVIRTGPAGMTIECVQGGESVGVPAYTAYESDLGHPRLILTGIRRKKGLPGKILQRAPFCQVTRGKTRRNDLERRDHSSAWA